MFPSLNVLGSPLKSCSHEPLSGWFRDGKCNTDASDRGSHTVAAIVTDDFLACLKEQGNDLCLPAPQHGFPGLVDGNRWCVCAGSWMFAYKQGRACPVDLEATHQAALSVAPLDALLEHAAAANA
ncbi:MAG: hypothetical protein ACJATT_005876 [Myxococcota bacterium]